jgi:hypothetical protein
MDRDSRHSDGIDWWRLKTSTQVTPRLDFRGWILKAALADAKPLTLTAGQGCRGPIPAQCLRNDRDCAGLHGLSRNLWRRILF